MNEEHGQNEHSENGNPDDRRRSTEDAEVSKLLAEAEKLREEKSKLEVERRELERQYGLPWYKKSNFLKAVSAGIVAFPLIWFFLNEITIPLATSENIKLKLQNEQVLDSLQTERGKLENLEHEKERLTHQIDSLSSLHADLSEGVRQLLFRRDSLEITLRAESSKLEATDSLVVAYERAFNSAKEHIGRQDSLIESQKDLIQKLRARITKTDTSK